MSLVTLIQRPVDFQEVVEFEALRRLHLTPNVSQQKLGLSLDSINFCFQALVENGKMKNFNQSKNKLRYAYLLTPDRVAEYEVLQKEIEQLRFEISGK